MTAMIRIPRCNVLGVGVSATNPAAAADFAVALARSGSKGYIGVTGVHGVMEAQRDEALRGILNRASLNVPDGMPTVWVGRSQGFGEMRRVYGPDLMTCLCERSVREGQTHFLYGGQPGVAEQLKANLERRFPGIRVVGTFTPPFRPLTTEEHAELARRVSEAQPDFFWVGLSTPKQERFMAECLPRLDVKVMLGVGAAFDVWTGNIRDAPRWVKKAGLQWAHRLIQEPKRLWRRYAYIVPAFLVLILFQALGLRKYRLDG